MNCVASVDLSSSRDESFFVVTKAGEKSSLSDVLTEATLASLQDLVRGGAPSPYRCEITSLV